MKDFMEKASKIKLLIMDVDGTLTDASMYFSERGEELKRFSTRDGMGIELLHAGGIETAIITSEKSRIVLARAKKLRINNVILGSHNKTKEVEKLRQKFDFSLENIAYIGDDVNDIHAMKKSGFSACPADSTEEIKKIADYICKNKGGNGAVRELAELILSSQNKSIILNENW